jgi:hypothetical protein
MTVSRQEEDSPSMCIRMAYVQRCTCVCVFFCLTRVSFFVGQRKVDQAKKKGTITCFHGAITFVDTALVGPTRSSDCGPVQVLRKPTCTNSA